MYHTSGGRPEPLEPREEPIEDAVENGTTALWLPLLLSLSGVTRGAVDPDENTPILSFELALHLSRAFQSFGRHNKKVEGRAKGIKTMTQPSSNSRRILNSSKNHVEREAGAWL